MSQGAAAAQSEETARAIMFMAPDPVGARRFAATPPRLGRSSWNRSVQRAYQPLPCMRPINCSAGVSM